MIDITHKSVTQRIALAEATVQFSSSKTSELIKNNQVPKGNVLEIARAAGLLGVKKTPELIPDCHPLPIEGTSIDYQLEEDHLIIHFEVKTIYKTGVEVEAMHGASIVALTVYDMLKPVDKGIQIQNIRLLKKKGGKSSGKRYIPGLKAEVIICSDSISKGEKEDRAGLILSEKLKALEIQVINYEIIPDDVDKIQEKVNNSKADLLIFTGGTGAGPRDNTHKAIEPLIDVELEGVGETIRRYGQDRMPYAMLSRSLAGIKGQKLILAFPGSSNGARESFDAVFPHILHVFRVMEGTRHE